MPPVVLRFVRLVISQPRIPRSCCGTSTAGYSSENSSISFWLTGNSTPFLFVGKVKTGFSIGLTCFGSDAEGSEQDVLSIGSWFLVTGSWLAFDPVSSGLAKITGWVFWDSKSLFFLGLPPFLPFAFAVSTFLL